MSMYSLEELLIRWRGERLTAEQLLGQLLQHVIRQQTEIHALQRQMYALEKTLKEFKARGSRRGA